MKPRACLFAAVFTLALFFAHAEAAIEQGELRIASWNVRNYLEVDRWVDGHYLRNYPKPENEKTALREVICELKPDILVLQEMGDEPFLLELQNDLKNEGLEYEYSLVAQAEDTHRHLAMLSRFEPQNVVVHDVLEFNYHDEPHRVKRGLLELEFDWKGEHFKVYSVHLKSRWTDYDDDPSSSDRRRKEAMLIRNRIRKSHDEDGLPYLVMGDFNDGPNSSAVRLMSTVSGKAFAAPLLLEDSRGEVWTHYYPKEGVYSRIDYILGSEDFPWFAEGRRGHIVDLPQCMQASDHRMVYVDLKKE